MSHLSLRARALVTASVGALALFGAAAPAAHAFQKTQIFNCTFPLVGGKTAVAAFDAKIPASVEANKPTGGWPIDIDLTVPNDEIANSLGASLLHGSIAVSSTVTAPGVNKTVTFGGKIGAGRPNGDFVVFSETHTGTVFPAITFPVPGTATVQVQKITLTLTAIGFDGLPARLDPVPGTIDSDGNPDTFDVACVPVPTFAAEYLATIQILGPPGPVAPSISALSPTHGEAIGGNEVVITGGFKTSPTTGVTFGGKPAELVSQTSTTTTVKAPGGAAGSTVDVVETSANGSSANTAADDYTYDSAGTVVPYAYSIAGSATLKTLVKGSVPLTGSIKAKVSLPSGAFTADLLLDPAKANLVALGFLPLTAEVQIVSTTPVTGSLVGGVLNANAKVRIKLLKLSFGGIDLVGNQATCQTKSPSIIPLKSTDAFFKPLVGGPIAGTFAISDLTGCGYLTGLFSSLTAGRGNAIALNLTPSTAIPPPTAN